MSIFDGTDVIINRGLFGALSVEYQQKTALRMLTMDRLAGLNGEALVRSLYEHTFNRWRAAMEQQQRLPSAQNWRFTLNTRISEANTSLEKNVEKRIAQLAEFGHLGSKSWANQVPVASGLLNPNADKAARIDLGWRSEDGACYDLIELKMNEGAGHVLFAAMEVLKYGVLYLFSRANAHRLGYSLDGPGLLGTRRLRLIVLAPASYYREVPLPVLSSLRDRINAGLASERTRLTYPDGPVIDLDFEKFGNDFGWPCPDNVLIDAVVRRHSIFITPPGRSAF